MRYVYAIREPGPLPLVTGLGGAAIEAVTVDGLEAVCSASAQGPRPGHGDLWQHQAVVEALMATGPVLPVRFGTRLEDDDLRARIRDHAAALSDGLARVRGHVEMGVRVLGEPPPQPAEPPHAQPQPAREAGHGAPLGSGRQYLLARAAEERAERAGREAAERLAGRLHRRIAARATASSLRVLPTEGTLMAGAYLVPAAAADDIRAVARDLATEHPDLAVVPTGPWPPYSFAPALEGEGAERVG